MTDQQAASDEQPQPTEDEQARAAEAESYGGQPIDDQELSDVWTSGGQTESSGPDGDVIGDPAGDDASGSDSDEGGATPGAPPPSEPSD